MAGESQLIRAYGDRRDDGVIQLSFTLPVPLSDKAREAARLFCTQLGLVDVKVAAAGTIPVAGSAEFNGTDTNPANNAFTVTINAK